MASEIRVLEDQLYDADYQNRVLQDKVQRLRQQSAATQSSVQNEPAAGQQPQEDSLFPRRPSDAGNEPEETFEPPWIEEGELADPSDLPGAVAPGGPDSQRSGRAGDDSSIDDLIPPSAPEPPGREDVEMLEVLPGELLPPASNDDDANPPGKIPLPNSIQAATSRVPHSLRIHRGLSGGHQFDADDQIDGLYLVVNAVDRLGKTVDISAYDIDAELTVVVLDPTLESDVARIGRWEFTAAQVQGLIRDEPISGLHVPLRWQEIRPASDEVIVHVRLRADEDEMRCDEKLAVGAAAAMAKWAPRGD